MIGGLGPPVAGILLTYLEQDTAGRQDYWRRVIDFKRISPAWWAVILLFTPVRGILAVAVGALAGESLPPFETALGFISQPLTLVPFLMYMLLFGPLPEELGWRGYALDRLQERWSALVSSLALGIMWGIWHLPLFFMQGTYQQAELGTDATRFLLNFFLSIVALTIVMTWVYNNTNRSILAAILIHFMENLTGEMMNLSGQMQSYKTACTIAAAFIVVVVFWRSKKLRQQQNTSEDPA